MYFLRFVARPKEGSERYGEVGGAYVNCWVNLDDETDAELYARRHIEDSGWTIEHKDDSRLTVLEDNVESETDLEYYQGAQDEGACFVFHTWPFGSAEDE